MGQAKRKIDVWKWFHWHVVITDGRYFMGNFIWFETQSADSINIGGQDSSVGNKTGFVIYRSQVRALLLAGCCPLTPNC